MMSCTKSTIDFPLFDLAHREGAQYGFARSYCSPLAVVGRLTPIRSTIERIMVVRRVAGQGRLSKNGPIIGPKREAAWLDTRSCALDTSHRRVDAKAEHGVDPRARHPIVSPADVSRHAAYDIMYRV
jgi:hypothetical protein